MLKNLLAHASTYSMGGLVTTVAGLISFPILTRMLSVSDYGLLSLVITTISFIAAFGKCGLQFSTLRYYSEVMSGKSQWSVDNFYSTIVLGMVSCGMIITLIWFALVSVLPAEIWNDDKLKFLFLLTAILVIHEVMVSMLSGILQAQQKSGLLTIFRICERYSVLILVVITLYFFSSTIEGVFTARIITQLSAVAILGYLVLRQIKISKEHFSPGMIKQMAFYGMPLLANEIVAVILGLGDRYIIQWELGSESLGNYAAAYNLCEYVKMMIVMAIFQAIRPIYFKLWAEEGREETKKFIDKSLYFYLMLCFPVIAGVSVLAPTLLDLLTGGKYMEGAATIPYIIAGLMIYGAHSMLGAGIFINKSSILVWLTLIAATINIGLNLLLVPSYGIVGAAVATLMSYVILVILEAMAGSRVIAIKFPLLAAIKFAVLAYVMYLLLNEIRFESMLLTMGVQVFAGGLIYGGLIFLTDKQAREIALSRFKSV